MSDRMVTCQVCGESVPHYAIYGDIGDSICADCYTDMIDAENGYEEWYGMAPHYHDMSRTGSIIGSTVFKPLPGTPGADGWYDMGDGEYFHPDKEAGGDQGIWRRYPNTCEKPTAPPFDPPEDEEGTR